jgi:ParB family chromosome partitioning protein
LSAALIHARVADIVVRDRLRELLPARVEAMIADYRKRGILTPIDLVETDEGLRLRFGAVRLAAVVVAGDEFIPAIVHPAGTFGSEAEIRAAEIAENLVRFELNALERSVSIAEWRVNHELAHPSKPGRKKKLTGDETLEEMSANFALNFSETVQRTLGLSRRAVFLALKVASIDPEARALLAPHPVADNQSELLALAAQAARRQMQIAELLRNGGASSVGEAIAQIDRLPPPVSTAAYEKLADRFSRLKEPDQHRFFDLHADAIARWRAARRS